MEKADNLHDQMDIFSRNYWKESEKAMAPHSSVLAWIIPGTREPGGPAVYGITQSRTRLK